MKPPLEAIREACLAANPKLYYKKPFVVRGKQFPGLLEREPNLADVLYVIHATNPKSIFVDVRGDFWEWANIDVVPLRNSYVRWNLLLPLEGQSDDTLQFLSELLTQQ